MPSYWPAMPWTSTGQTGTGVPSMSVSESICMVYSDPPPSSVISMLALKPAAGQTSPPPLSETPMMPISMLS